MRAIEAHLGIHGGQTTADGLFTLTEVECLGACVNAPMLQVNDDYYEDLTAATTVALLKALQQAAEVAGEHGTGHGSGARPSSETMDGRHHDAVVGDHASAYEAGGATLPASGPQSGRTTCENSAGLTSLTSTPWGNEMLRKDGQL